MLKKYTKIHDIWYYEGAPGELPPRAIHYLESSRRADIKY